LKILITGSQGFIGKNLVTELKNRGYNDLLEFDKNTDKSLLEQYTKNCEFVFHLAGINRPLEESEFMEGNFGFTSELLALLQKHNNKSTILITSSTQAENDNPYGLSKRAGEKLVYKYSRDTGAKTITYRLPNVFGKWCRPNYNSAVATFCYNIANGLPITINDPNVTMKVVYIDDVIKEFINALGGMENRKDRFCQVEPVNSVQLGKIAELILSFKESRDNKSIPDMSDSLVKKLYSTYLSYLPIAQFSYPLHMNIDNRGSFSEFIKTEDRGQVSINISKPGITKGNHWHHSKNEKFLVVSGEGIIRFRKIDSSEVVEYMVSGDKLEVIDIPTGYTHNISNTGSNDMVTVMWANEQFDKNNPDTYFLEV